MSPLINQEPDSLFIAEIYDQIYTVRPWLLDLFIMTIAIGIITLFHSTIYLFWPLIFLNYIRSEFIPYKRNNEINYINTNNVTDINNNNIKIY